MTLAADKVEQVCKSTQKQQQDIWQKTSRASFPLIVSDHDNKRPHAADREATVLFIWATKSLKKLQINLYCEP